MNDNVMQDSFETLYQRAEVLLRAARMLLADMDRFRDTYFKDEPTWLSGNERSAG